MADIYINYGTHMQDMTYALMEAADIAAELRPDMRVCIKPNLVVARPADGGATTHPEIVEGIIRYLRDNGVKNIIIAEGSWVGDSTKRAWKTCGYSALRDKYNVELLDTKDDSVEKRKSQGIELTLCRSILNADYLINVPVLKGHCQTDMTCCLKSLKGCIPDSEKRRFHTMGLHKPIAALAAVLKPNLHIVDSICGDLSFEEGGNPIESNRILLGRDPVLLDSYGAQLMGYHPDEIDHLFHAKAYGAGQYADDNTDISELNADRRPKTVLQRSSQAKRLGQFVNEDGACSACYAALIFALNKAGNMGLRNRINIGQGFKGKTCAGIGVGNCTAGCDAHVAGCPPKAVEIVDFLRSL
ncbi:MAG: DUF362 domain-containing protein [Oscillospiraceae bacterium]|jgi:uncharacterized protein (DUF362 family)|nr:DUF362 domain-containing protein [Oscillospiraceae bacterium]